MLLSKYREQKEGEGTDGATIRKHYRGVSRPSAEGRKTYEQILREAEAARRAWGWKAALPAGRLSMGEVGCEKIPWSTQRGKMRGRMNGTRGTDAWLLESRQVEIECLKEIVKSLSYTKEKLLAIIINPGNYDEETIEKAWDHLKMIDEGLSERKDGVLSSKVHHLLIEIKKELKKMKKTQGEREQFLSSSLDSNNGG